MTAYVETRHRAECYECGWISSEWVYYAEADEAAEAHNASVHPDSLEGGLTNDQ